MSVADVGASVLLFYLTIACQERMAAHRQMPELTQNKLVIITWILLTYNQVTLYT